MTRRVAIGALWMALFKLLERGISLISTLILARLLLPRDFGIVAMGTSLIALLELISAFGLETALIQRRQVDEKHYNAAWTLNILAGGIVGVLMIAIAVPASHFYREPNLVLVVMALGVCAIVQGLENIRVVDFRRNLDFDREFRYLLTKKVMQYFRGHYLPREADWLDWRASPLLAKSLANLPPACVMTAGFDPLRDEGKAYADRLAKEGVKTEYRNYADMVHGFITMGRVLDTANAALADCALALKKAWGTA